MNTESKETLDSVPDAENLIVTTDHYSRFNQIIHTGEVIRLSQGWKLKSRRH